MGRGPKSRTFPAGPTRDRVDHVVIIDGSMSTLRLGYETNAGLLYKLLCEMAPDKRISLRYEAGIQWRNWTSARDVIEGRGINRQIRRVYGFIASRYRPGDRIFLFGYSRGAYAVRSLAGVIDRVGLLRPEYATVRHIRDAYRHYERGGTSEACERFTQLYCHDAPEIEMLGVWDTVKALGMRLPVLWRWTETKHRFHNHELGAQVKHAYHALARDETREAFAPVLWDDTEDFPGHVEQVWFRGSHGDVGGQLSGFLPARPLSNIPLVWMLERVEACGLALPRQWRARFPCDAQAPSVGTLRGWGPLFMARRRRVIGADPSERVHPTADPAPMPKQDRADQTSGPVNGRTPGALRG
nr:DUF2235 domain-containing protein [Candidatus Rhodobacter lobularis]